ncbi:LVIVD repeat-containing protein [Actinomadura sp. HBU206391]|uniref:LVIVD repeat-containing protein n=1 Tax=Actinomadura sp. HBU206391 TaxID=2731692 RepID=UPI00165052E6|nr:hypothetical protein [Actinomadura sp. HBU206391]MBC6462481.1 hypothetical protein [Actinomadura sp. HBU206391]
MAHAKKRKVSAWLATTVAAALTTFALASPPAAAAEIPPVDAVAKSDNIRHLANIPKQAPFDSEANLNSDLAFQGKYAFSGNYAGVTILDISKPSRPKIVSQVVCPGSQNDVSVNGDLMYLSTDSARSDDSCNSTSATPPTPGGSGDENPANWQGIKVFDISDVRNPRYVKSVETKCGSHTHTLVPDNKRRADYLYIQSYGPQDRFPKCQPPHDKISIVKVPRDRPTAAAVVSEPVLFPEGGFEGVPGSYPNGKSATSGCHDITAYPEKDLAAGACMGDGVLFDISDRARPRVITGVRDTVNFAFWHSATFNNSGSKVVFTDELGGGGTATCNAAIGDLKGANGIYDIVGKGHKRKLVFRSYYKIPRHQADTENCVAHNGSLIPVKGKDLMVQAWYQGGVSVWDFTDSSRPREIGYFERGPLSDTRAVTGGAWSAYYYNGYVYSNDIQKGFDVLEIDDRRVKDAKRVRLDQLNVQTQPDYYDR